MTDHPSNTLTPKGFSIASLIAALASLALMLVYLTTVAGVLVMYAAMILGIAGVVLGIVALKKRQPKGMALTGLIIGAVSFILGLAIIIFALAFVGVFMSESPYN